MKWDASYENDSSIPTLWKSQNSNQTNQSLELYGNEKYSDTLWDENEIPLLRMYLMRWEWQTSYENDSSIPTIWESQNYNWTNQSLNWNCKAVKFLLIQLWNEMPLMRMTVASQKYENLKILTELTRV